MSRLSEIGEPARFISSDILCRGVMLPQVLQKREYDFLVSDP